MKYMSNIEQVE